MVLFYVFPAIHFIFPRRWCRLGRIGDKFGVLFAISSYFSVYFFPVLRILYMYFLRFTLYFLADIAGCVFLHSFMYFSTVLYVYFLQFTFIFPRMSLVRRCRRGGVETSVRTAARHIWLLSLHIADNRHKHHHYHYM